MLKSDTVTLLPEHFRKKQVISLLFYSFITAVVVFAPVIIPFFTEWGKLNMAQILTLQSVYLLVSLLAEIPTGVVADKFGRKVSVMLGGVSFALGALLYSVVPWFWVFIIAESLMGVGKAFNSGAMEALEYESLKDLGLGKEYLFFVYRKRAVQLAGNVLSGVLAFLLVNVLPIRYFMALYALFHALGLVVLLFLVAEPHWKERREFVPNYSEIVTKSLRQLRKSPWLFKLGLVSLGLFVVSYFQFWLYQKIFLVSGIRYSYFGVFTVVLYILGMIWSWWFPRWYKRLGLKRLSMVSLWVVLTFQLVILGSREPLLLIPGVLFLVSFTKELRFLPSKAINDLIESDIRSTVLSFISLFRSLALAVFNPLVGALADKNVFLALILTGFLGTLVVFFALRGYKPDFRERG